MLAPLLHNQVCKKLTVPPKRVRRPTPEGLRVGTSRRQGESIKPSISSGHRAASITTRTIVTRSALCVGLLTLGTGACSSNLTQSDPLGAERCDPPAALLASAGSQPFTLEALHDAAVHAAGPMASALGSSDEVRQLVRAMEGIATRDGSHATDTACRLVIVAGNALDALGNDPATLPDRDGIRLVLILASGVIQAHAP